VTLGRGCASSGRALPEPRRPLVSTGPAPGRQIPVASASTRGPASLASALKALVAVDLRRRGFGY